jgi:hypothetical protein
MAQQYFFEEDNSFPVSFFASFSWFFEKGPTSGPTIKKGSQRKNR